MIEKKTVTTTIPTLTLTPNLKEEAPLLVEEEVIEPEIEETDVVCQELRQLSEEEYQVVKNFSEQIDITDTGVVMHYGAASQKHVAEFSTTTLNTIRSKDMGDVGRMLVDLTVELQGLSFDEEQRRGIRGLFRKAQNQLSSLKAQFDKAEVNVNKIVAALENHQIQLLKDIALLDRMHELNAGYFKELTMYILAGKQKVQSVQANELKVLQEKAIQSGRTEDAEATNDLANRLNRFEKKLHDLELTRMVSIQMAPQIRMIQNNDTLMLEKIQTSIINTIPLWKSQMILALSMNHSQQAMQAQEKVNNLTNDLLTKNSEKLKMGTMEIAQASERGIVDIETLKQTNRNLIDTLDEVREIQVEGSKRRQEASVELIKIESELKQKLVEVGGIK